MAGVAVTDRGRELLHVIESHGGRIELVGGEPRLVASRPLPREVVRAAQDHRLELLELLISNAEMPAAIPPDLGYAYDFRAAWAGAARELAELCGYPRLPFATARSVAPGEALWGKFVHAASVPDLQLVVRELQRRVSRLPLPADPFGKGPA